LDNSVWRCPGKIPGPRSSRLTSYSSSLTPDSAPLTPHSSPLTPRSTPLTPHSSPLTPRSTPLTSHSSSLTPHSSPPDTGRTLETLPPTAVSRHRAPRRERAMPWLYLGSAEGLTPCATLRALTIPRGHRHGEVLTSRNPKLRLRTLGPKLPRYPDRTLPAPYCQLPPRATRYEPDSSPAGSSAGNAVVPLG